jgi:cobalamin-dependent methionine synthase I
MMTFFSSAVRSRDGAEEDKAEEGVADAVSEALAEGVRSDVMVPVDEPAQAASARLAVIAEIVLDGIVGKVGSLFRAPQIINNCRRVANR